MYQKKVKESNKNNIFKYIFEKRKSFVINDIAENLNITFPTVKKIINSFLKQNIIFESQKVGFGVGRKAMEYELNEEFCYSIGILASSTKLKFILTNAIGKILKQQIYELKSNNCKAEILNSTKDFLNTISPEVRKKLIGIGISVPGIVSEEGNFIEFSSKEKIVLSFIEELKNLFHIPVLIENESNLAAIAEAFLTRNSIYSTFTILTINEYVGISNFHQDSLNNTLFFKAGRLHHMVIESNGKLCECGTHGCWGTYVSDKVLLNDFQKYFPSIKTYNEIFDLKYHETNIGASLIDNYLEHLAIGIKNILFFSNPEKLIISGNISIYKEYIADKLIEKIYKNHIFYRGKETIVFSSLNENGSIIGAAMFPILDKII